MSGSLGKECNMSEQNLEEKIRSLQALIDGASKIVFFGGAGVSTESGLKDFRSQDGLYHEHYKYPPETILSHSFFMHQPEDFYRFYFDKLLVDGLAAPKSSGQTGLPAGGERLSGVIEPNAAHKKLAEMETAGKLSAVITQNIDGLHQRAGSRKVFELHGSIHRNHCMSCGHFFDGEYLLAHRDAEKPVPHCPVCGGIIKPDVVLYEEGLDQSVINGALEAIEEADLLIIGGTSLTVYPAAGFIRYYRGNHLVLINRDATGQDELADLVIHGSIGEILGKIRV